jgi:hypothetical protein
MGRMIAIALAVLVTAIMFLSPVAKAQQADFRQAQDAAMAAAGGPDFQRTGLASVGIVAHPLQRQQASGPFPPQPYQHSRIELQPAAQTSPPPIQTGRTAQVADVAEADQKYKKRYDAVKAAVGDFLVTEDDIRSGYDPLLIARSYARFGHGVAENPARQQWMADQEQRAIANDINRTKPLVYPISGR